MLIKISLIFFSKGVHKAALVQMIHIEQATSHYSWFLINELTPRSPVAPFTNMV